MNKLNIMLNKFFGFDSFRAGQEEVIRSVLGCKDTLAVMPTGGGKSLCYQLPAALLPGTTLVISPLIALMKDQVDSLSVGNIKATSINSSLSFPEINQRLASAANGYYKLLYIAPERLESKSFLNLLHNIQISFLAVDEAHCISEWGHDFRPSYMNIKKIFDFIPRCPILALTATATTEVQDDIVSSLNLVSPTKVVKGFDRENLRYFTEFSDSKISRVADLVSSVIKGSTIVYAGSRKRVDSFVKELLANGIKAEPYHAGMRVLLRNAVQERFIEGKTRVIVATNAFGMGIDKADVRKVIHVDYPLTLEAYYQEAGRAGRDGLNSECHLIISNGDRALPEFFIRSTYPDIKSINRVIDELVAGIKNQAFVNTDNYSIPDPINIANSIGLDYRSVNSIYGILERSGAISKGHIRSNAQIMITTSRERISEYFDNSTPERQHALESLLRSVSPDVFSRSVAISIKDLIVKHSVSKQDFDELLKSMQMLRLIKFNSESEESGYHFTKYFTSSEELKIDSEALSRRCAYALNKFEKMVEYSKTNICKRNYILDYFDDKEYQNVCGKCTSCISIKIKNDTNSSNNKFLNSNILSLIYQSGGQMKSSDLKNQLLVYYSGQSGEFANNGSKINLLNDSIVQEINNLNRSRLIEFEDKYRISITQTGTEFLKQLPEQSKTMARIEKSKTKSEIIFNKLVTLRREIAENAGVVPRGIISDVAMRKIADVMPETEFDLKNVAGVSQLFVQKFAKLFLHELAKIKLNPKEQKVSKVAKDALKLLDQGESFDTIQTRLFAGNLTMTANYVVEILDAGFELPRKQLVPDAVYTKVKACLKKNPEFGISDVQSKLTVSVDHPVLKMACAFAKAELGIL